MLSNFIFNTLNGCTDFMNKLFMLSNLQNNVCADLFFIAAILKHNIKVKDSCM